MLRVGMHVLCDWNLVLVAWTLLNQAMLLPTQYPGMPTFPSASMAIARSAEAALCWRLSCRVSATPEHAKLCALQRLARHAMPPAACTHARISTHGKSLVLGRELQPGPVAVKVPLCYQSSQVAYYWRLCLL